MVDLSRLSDEELLQLYMKKASQNKLAMYRPYGHPDTHEEWWHNQMFGEVREWTGKSWQLDFHNAGATHKQRLVMAANGVGKSESCSAETAIHATGLYPEWWEGWRFDKPTHIWVGAIDNAMQKEGPQRALFGRDCNENLGTGFIPYESIVELEFRQAGIKEVIDTAVIRHKAGGHTILRFKTFEQGWRKWQSGDPDIIQMDEEPNELDMTQRGVFSEILTRLVRNSGILYCGYTPLLGETDLTRHFMYPKSEGVWWVGATWDDAPHLKQEDKEMLRLQYGAHELEARTMGVPMMGEGRIFTTPEDEFVIPPFKIPEHWAFIIGVDFGIDHPAAVAKLAWDRDNDVVYLVDVWKKSGCELSIHAQAIKDMGGERIPVAWPHDGAKRDPDSGKEYSKMYRHRYGVGGMLSRSARYENDKGGAQPQWPIIERLQDRLDTGRFKVFTTCLPWLEEYRSYHTKEGKIVSLRDDALKASFYALMDLRYARSGIRAAGRRRRSGPSVSTRL